MENEEDKGPTELIKKQFETTFLEKKDVKIVELVSIIPQLQSSTNPEIYTNKVCSRLVEQGYLECKKGKNCTTYALSKREIKRIEDRNKRLEEVKKAQQEELDVTNSLTNFLTEVDVKDVLDGLIHTNTIKINMIKVAEEDYRLADFIYEDAERAIKLVRQIIEDNDVLTSGNDTHPQIIFENIESHQVRSIRFATKSKYLKTLSVIEGIVVATTQICPKPLSITYQCRVCGDYRIKKYKMLEEITKPYLCECDAKNSFEVSGRKLIDFVKMKVQQPYEEVKDQAKQILCVLAGEIEDERFKNHMIAGNRIKLTGHVDTTQNKKDAHETPYFFINNYEVKEDKWNVEGLTDGRKTELETFIGLNKEDSLARAAAMIAPELIGMQLEKEAVLCSLIGSHDIEFNGNIDRGNIHCLLIGNPSTGKSHLLNWIGRNIPKVLTATGGTSSMAGLLATVDKDKEMGGYTVQSGTVVLASDGTVTLDEINNLDSEKSDGLKECMENQTVTVNKATIHTKLRANTTIIAGGNPKTGVFDKNKSILEQFSEFSIPLLSRFDIKIAVNYGTMEEELAKAQSILNRGKVKSPISPDNAKFVVDLITYARSFKPELSNEADALIMKYYTLLKKNENPTDPYPPRTVACLKRMAIAIARLNLHSTVSESDAQQAINLHNRAVDTMIEGLGTNMNEFEWIVKPEMASKKILDQLAQEWEEIPRDAIVAAFEKRGMDPEKYIRKYISKGILNEHRSGFFVMEGSS